ncbi:alkylation response protein AidB-like acyl-CoA dehydrogenase [Amycolatopsis bartoniae]|uniref:Acyl-CoA dehydrogenase n=1 Tax=Amycolatopsis bartoniae TaxID=941986 RepID=A0A8H9IV24_9PSEU|nr:acyl-CoA dehydrogenase family protein [Amycolatopsis bartoniae]MBB2939665.1 alkylation response protein AidB-like acyl-CoA dehydrogenase [Amycolatopsis bartoniae]TVT06229.1 acyl-CoA dehydrogenase [Amycolatopsis bartoniae]GHF36668.1 acyl-CoA dehydrogenase [Amycolatopsis bartoniae]
MSFEVPESVRPIRRRVLDFLETHVYPAEQTLLGGGEQGRDVLRELEEKAKSDGLWALGHPRHLGGGGLSMLDYAYVNEVIGRSEPATQVFGTTTLQTVLMLDPVATDEQRERWVLPSVAGDLRLAFAMTEPGVSSSDPTQFTTTARLENDEWVLTGRKWFISAADRSAATIVMARTEPDAPAHEAFSMILVERDTPGYDLVRDIEVMGMRGVMSGHFEIEFDNARVPAANIIGGRGDGFKLAQQRLGPGRIFHCMRWLGSAQRAFDYLCERANSRTLKGEPLARKQLVQKFVFDSYQELKASRLLVLDAAAKLDSGDQARVELSSVKVHCAQTVHNVIDRAMQVWGAEGMSNLLPLEAMYREARFGRVVDGPDEVHVQRVATRILRSYENGEGWDFGER